MKYIVIIILSVLLYSCSTTNMKPSYFTEAYIKTNLQDHIKEEVSTISIKSKYKAIMNNETQVVEYSFVEYNNSSYFVLTINDLSIQSDGLIKNQPHIKIFNKIESKKLLAGIKDIIEKINLKPLTLNNVDYYDYSVSEDLYFSAVNNQQIEYNSYVETNPIHLYVWFGINKYRIFNKSFVDILEEFNSISK